LNAHDWQFWLERLYNLRRDKRGSHERPHKPVLLLSIIDLLDRGVIKRNEIPLSDELVATFKRYFDVVRKLNDQPTIENPFFHLSGDKFWHLISPAGHEPLYQEGYASGPPSIGQFRKRVAFAKLDEPLWALFRDDVSRHQLREALIARYFPEERERLAAVAVDSASVKQPILNDALPPTPARDAAFRRTILEVYDYRCAACGVRVLLDHTLSLVEAAHLIPFNESHNDKPTNGVALCPNHHWAIDRLLIAPCPDEKRVAGIWRINRTRLDKRIEGQRDLVALDGEPVIAPSEEKFYPALESLRWRAGRLSDSNFAGVF
jgi:putative restriction endonuclease